HVPGVSSPLRLRSHSSGRAELVAVHSSRIPLAPRNSLKLSLTVSPLAPQWRPSYGTESPPASQTRRCSRCVPQSGLLGPALAPRLPLRQTWPRIFRLTFARSRDLGRFSRELADS